MPLLVSRRIEEVVQDYDEMPNAPHHNSPTPRTRYELRAHAIKICPTGHLGEVRKLSSQEPRQDVLVAGYRRPS